MKRLLATPGRGAVPSPPGYIDMEGVKELVVTSPTAYRGCRGLVHCKKFEKKFVIMSANS